MFAALQFAGRVEDAPLMEAVVFVQDLLRDGRALRRVDPATFPTAFIPRTLRRHLFVETKEAPRKQQLQVDLYEFLVYRLVRNALQAGDLYVADSTEFRRFEDGFGRFEFTRTGTLVDLDALAERHDDPDFWNRALREGGSASKCISGC